VLLVFCTPARALDVQFDFRFDRSGFFDASGVEGAVRRAALEAAAAPFAAFPDALAAIVVGTESDRWRVSFLHPSWTSVAEVATVENLAVDANTITVFVGASPSFGSVLGIASPGDLAVEGSAAFRDLVSARGQPGALDAVPSDFGPWGGAIWFNSRVRWHFGLGTDGLDADESDFITTATHELAHLLGLGTAPSWDAQVVPGTTPDAPPSFVGPAAVAAFGGPVPLDVIAAHWAEGVASTRPDDGQPQETLMDPTTRRGTRELPTHLDLAGLHDIGWQVTAIPEPATAPLSIAGLLATGVAIARRRLRC
jgi:hypothetical protein